MAKKDPRVDAYIQDSAAFARPILRHLRQVVHRACPAVEETVKWGVPHFMYRGILCSMASFKAHCTFGFWRPSALSAVTKDPDKLGQAMGQYGRITGLTDLPSDATITRLIRQAMAANESDGARQPGKTAARTHAKPPVVVPQVLASALARSKRAKATFDALSPSHQREYADWIAEAKREQTQARRIETTLAYLEQGKPLNWKYMKG